jgi:hypothetical protein
MARQPYKRDKQGIRFKPGGMNTVKSIDLIPPGEYAYIQNCRAYLQERFTGRATQGPAQLTLTGPIHSIRRMNDTTPLGPPAGYVLIVGSASDGEVYCNATKVATGLSGNPISILPFRPNTSVQPWAYIGDPSTAVTLEASGFQCFGMIKVRSDGLTYKTGIKEPQFAPTVSTTATTTEGTDILPATAIPWTNYLGANSSFNYGESNGYPSPTPDGTAPIIIATPVVGSTVSWSITGTATVNGATHAPGDAGPSTGSHPGAFITSPSIVVGAFTDGSGNVIVSPSGTINIGASNSAVVPAGAAQLQLGVNSLGNSFSSNSGQFVVSWTVTTSAIATSISTIGSVTAYIWGDSPQSGQVASYIWKNPGDAASFGTARSIGTATVTTTNNSWQIDTTPDPTSNPTDLPQWDTLASNGSVTGDIPLFPAPFTQSAPNTTNFNACIVGSLFIPSPGSFTLTFQYKDQIMFGMGGGATASTGPATGANGQTISVANGLPLLFVSTPNGTGGAQTTTIIVTVAASGTYDIEIDWDFWYHAGRSMTMTANGAVIPPISQAVRTNVVYWAKYRSSVTGAQSNPSPASSAQSTPVVDNTVSVPFSPDPQVDKVDYYRQDSGLANPTYVATGPNTNPPTPITDSLSDLAAANNQIMATDDFEPFPSIDLPKSGTVNVVGGLVEWVSGDTFNVRWLPGTVILIGSPTQLAYSLYSRPTSTTTMMIPEVPSGTNLAYNIAEPILAAQPLPSLWGPTDNTAYYFGCGDFLRPGTLYFTKGNAPDSAPDTNQIEATSPSEPLMGGCVVDGISMVFSTERAWLCYPTFTTALATVSGVQGSPFNLILSIADRGLYIRNCLCVEGGINVFFRGKDGIYVSPGGSGSQSLTDKQIYNLFPHEGNTSDGTGGFVPQPVQIGPYTVWPPDDTQPSAQQLSFANGYLYYDYQDVNSVPRTLVYDVAAKGWSVDVYAGVVTIHALEEGPNVNGTLVGTTGGTISALIGTADPTINSESATSIVATGAVDGGDARAYMTVGDVFVRIQAPVSQPVNVALYSARYANAIAGFLPTQLAGTGTLTDYIVDFPQGPPENVSDIELILSWATVSETIVDTWQPSFFELPEGTRNRPTDFDDCGILGNKFIQGFLLEANTFGNVKSIQVQRSDDLQIFTPLEVPQFNGQTTIAFSFQPPFLAHLVRLITDDGVLWRNYSLQWVVKPYPEAAFTWQTEGGSNGLVGYMHCYQINLVYVSTQPVTVTLITDQGSFSQVWPASGAQINPVKVLQKFPAPNKFKVVSYSVTSPAPFFLWKEDVEVWLHQWNDTGVYRKIKPWGGPTQQGAAEV